MVDYLIFGGVKSSDYGIYISGEALYDAPKRDVEAVTVPGRNGEIMLDKGRWQNITVTYPAFTYSPTYASFISSIATFRNAIASKVGYQRLEDTFNTGEYRMGAFVDGVDVNPIMYNSGATFDLVFNCKPQRFLTAGESEQSIASGGTITNPTAYDASPLIEVEGYGAIEVNGFDIELTNETFGTVELAPRQTVNMQSAVINLADTPMTVGDSISTGMLVSLTIKATGTVTDLAIGTPTVSGPAAGARTNKAMLDTDMFRVKLWLDGISFSKSTASVGVTAKATSTVSCKVGGTSVSFSFTAQAKYYGADNFIEVSGGATSLPSSLVVAFREMTTDAIIGESTATILGHPTYVDCDLGECYKIENGTVVSLNRYIDLGSDLPVLAPGSNSITYDNTVTSLKVVPMWWQL